MTSDFPLHERRVINGLLKSLPTLATASAASSLLRRDIELIIDPLRVDGDLWPCIWALAAALGRQFQGTIFVDCGLRKALSSPVPLPTNCVFAPSGSNDTFRIAVGTDVRNPSLLVDARGRTLAIGKLIDDSARRADPISCFALAGYTAFAAMASCAEIPSFRKDFCLPKIELPGTSASLQLSGLTLVGLGQLGQAYLSLLFFLGPYVGRPSLFLIDKDRFEPPNGDTQILLSGTKWEGEFKTEYLRKWARSAGFPCEAKTIEINWGWEAPAAAHDLALLGLDDLDVRRMCAVPKFQWLIESGIGTSFAEPRITWHSLPSSAFIARRLFSANAHADRLLERIPIAKELKKTPGECGWVKFKDVRASAPSMGLVAAAYAFTELLSYASGEQFVSSGSAYLWSPLLPFLLERKPRALGSIPRN